MCKIEKLKKEKYFRNQNFEFLFNQDVKSIEFENDGITYITRRYTRKTGSSQPDIEIDFERHSKVTKSTLERLELSTGRDLDQILELIPRQPKSEKIKNYSLEKINFSGMAKPIEGGLGTDRAERKEQQLKNLIHALAMVVREKSIIVDFCAGGGHFGLAAAQHFPSAHIVIVDCKQESLRRAKERIKKGNIKNVTILQANLRFWNSPFDVGLGLHACGSATDQILTKCLDWNGESYIMSHLVISFSS